ncbi:MAG: hypothetical protein F4X59_18080 [Holophagales bacterium]|nr:hypothetical protein [Holophagales bacterium]MYC12015.1 hypothetical protein [Holophagales bacterium]
MLETVARELAELGIEARVVSWNGAGGAGVVFQLRAPSGRLKGRTLQIGLSFQENAYPEYPPHFVHFHQEEVEGTEFTRHSEHGFEGALWWAFSFPPSDFWDGLDPPQKNMRTFVRRHLYRVLEQL